MKLSPFRLQLFDTCKQQFKFVVKDDLSDVYGSPKPYLTMGAHVHNTLKDLYDLPVEKRTANQLETILRKRWTENRSGFLDEKEEKKYGMKAVKMLRLFAHRSDLSLDPFQVEEFKYVEVTPEVALTGRIDRVDKEKDGLHIIDYKTGQFNEKWVSPLQLKLYAVMVAGSDKAPVSRASFLYLPSYTWYTVDIDDDILQETTDYLLERAEEIRAEKEFAPTVGNHCKFCDFHDICPEKESVLTLLNEQDSDKFNTA